MANSSGSYVILRHAFCLNRSKITPVQQPHCPSRHEQGNLNPGKNGLRVVVMGAAAVEAAGTACVLFFDITPAFCCLAKRSKFLCILGSPCCKTEVFPERRDFIPQTSPLYANKILEQPWNVLEKHNIQFP